MIRLVALLLLLSASPHAAPVKALFGTQRFTPDTTHTVTGPLVQFQTETGATLSFQQGARFTITEDGTVTLASGNLRIGPAGEQPLTLDLPQGRITVEPLTALTITAASGETTGRIYRGNLHTEGRTFGSGEGFVIKPSGAHGTFTPAAAQAPLPDEPTASGEATATASSPNLIRRPAYRLAQSSSPPADTSTGEEELPPITPEPQPQPQPETPTDPSTPEGPVTPDPGPQVPTLPETPHVETPTPVTRSGLLASFSDTLPNQPSPDNSHAQAGAFRLLNYEDGHQTLEEVRTGLFGLSTTKLSRGTALNLDATSNDTTAGLGRWVGGELVAVKGSKTSLIANSSTFLQDGEAVTSPNSLHYIWGEKASAIPTAGRISYNLFAATQPTYTGTAQSSEGATFAGSLAIDFNPQQSGTVGAYHLTGTLTMPQTVATENGPATSTATYQFSTPSHGVALGAETFNNPGTLSVTASAGAMACTSGCSGTVNAAGFGEGMNTVGTLYHINPGGEVGIKGAALFTAAP